MAWQEFAIRDFSEGVIDKIDDNLLPANAAAYSSNYICNTLGVLSKRKGQKQVNSTLLPGIIQGLHAYYEKNNRFLIAASAGKLYKLEKDGNFTELYSGLNAEKPVYFETCTNYMVCFNGEDNPLKYDSQNGVSVLQNAPAKGLYPTLFKEKLFVAHKDYPSQLWWSESFKPEEWPAINYWTFDEASGGYITGLKVFFDELVVLKNNGIHVLRGNYIGDFRSEKLETNVGCVGHKAIVEHKGFLYFVGYDGVYVFNGLRAKNITSERIPKLWARVNKANIHKAVVTAWQDYIWIALPFDDSVENNVVLMINTSNNAVWPMFTGFNIACFQKFLDEGGEVLYAGSNQEGILIKQWDGTLDIDKPIEAVWISKGFDVEEAEKEKKAKFVFIDNYPGEDNAINLEISVNYNDFVKVDKKKEDSLVKKFILPSELKKKWRYIRLKIEHNGETENEIRGILLPYKIKKKPKVRQV